MEMKLLSILLLGLLPVAYGYRCENLPEPVDGPHKGLPTRFVVLSRPLLVGDIFILSGKVDNGTVPFKRSTVDLLVGTKPVYYETVSTLHLTAQFDLNQTFIGDYQPNPRHENREDKLLPLDFTDDPFTLRILVEADGYSIYKDKVFLHKLIYFKEDYSTVQTIYLQNIDFYTECVIDCKEEKQCPKTGAGEMTIILGNRAYREVDGQCPQ
ncbi:unnamed protein product [Caenorhabditis auriculariae]|uniref:Galectin n=1 Tax=Caenorhabditis auriculariae TaxID=2777116 RepID=A0A8S1HEM3_9PELO|nr:unnamed protein product [Caenorhabditis auriculariae]